MSGQESAKRPFAALPMSQYLQKRCAPGGEPGKMVSPAALRAAVAMAQERFGISQRRACLIVGAHRSTHRRKVPFTSEEEFLRRRIRTMALRYPRYGYRRIHAILIREGYLINRKRVQGLWRLEG